MSAAPSAIRVPVPGWPGREVVCRTPAPGDLYLAGLLDLPLLQCALRLVAERDETNYHVASNAAADAQRTEQHLDAWVCLAMVLPTITPAPSSTREAVGVTSLPELLKLAVYDATEIPPTPAVLLAFIEQADGRLHHLDVCARRYGRRPSDLMGIAHPAHALDFDLAIAAYMHAGDQDDSMHVLRLLGGAAS